MQEEHGTTDHGKKAKLVWTHMQDEGQQAGEGGDVWNCGWRDEERKTVPRMVGQHQGVGWRGNSHTRQEGTGSRHVENGRHWTPTDGEPMEQ